MAGKKANIALAVGSIVAFVGVLIIGTRIKAAPETEPPDGGDGGTVGNLHGVLTDAETGEPLTNAHVAIGCYYENIPDRYYWCKDAYFDGEYCFELEPGRYVIWCIAPHYEDRYYYDFIVEEDTVLDIELSPYEGG